MGGLWAEQFTIKFDQFDREKHQILEGENSEIVLEFLKKMTQLRTYSSFAVLWIMDNSSPTLAARLSFIAHST